MVLRRAVAGKAKVSSGARYKCGQARPYRTMAAEGPGKGQRGRDTTQIF